MTRRRSVWICFALWMWMADGEITGGREDKERSQSYFWGRLLKSTVSLHCYNGDVIMIKPLSSCYQSDPIRTNSILKFSKVRNGKTLVKMPLTPICAAVVSQKIFFHLLSPMLLIKVLCQNWGVKPRKSGGSAGKTLAHLVYRELRTLLVVSR